MDTHARRYGTWEIVPATTLLVVALVVWGRALGTGWSLDVGLAYQGGVVAWDTGRPENLLSWISTPFLALVMALVSRGPSETQTAALMTWLNIVVSAGAIGYVWHRIRVATDLGPWAWWAGVTGSVLYAPLVSSIWWKQFNIVAVLLAAIGFDLVRRNRANTGGLMIAASILVKPLVLLLPVFLLFRRRTRPAAYFTVVWGVGLSVVSQVFLAVRAGDLAVLSPVAALRNFSNKSNPEVIWWVCIPENFSPHAVACRLLGTDTFVVQRLVVAALAILVVLAFAALLRRRPPTTWMVFAVACATSPLFSPIAWSHYQLLLMPLFIVLMLEFQRTGAPVALRLGLATAYGLAMLIWRPSLSLPGAVLRLLDGGRVTRDAGTHMMTVSMLAQYALLIVALAWLALTGRRQQSQRD